MSTDTADIRWSLLQKIFVIPNILVLVLFVVRIVDISVPSLVLGSILISSLIAVAGSIAMIFVQPDARQWRIVAIINGAPYAFWFIFIALLQLTHS